MVPVIRLERVTYRLQDAPSGIRGGPHRLTCTSISLG